MIRSKPALVRALDHYRRRTLLRAAAARHLAAVVRWQEGDEAFRAALTADLGIVELLSEADRLGDADMLDVEHTPEFDHAGITRRLLAERGVSGSLLATIHEARDAGDPGRLPGHAARLLYVAELLAAVLLDDRADLWPTLAEAAERHLRLSVEALAELGTAIEFEAAALGGASPEAPSADGLIAELLDLAGEAVVEKTAGTTPAPAAVEPVTPTTAASYDLTKLHHLLRSAAAECRRDETPLSLLFVEVAAEPGLRAAASAAHAAACASIDWAGAQVTEVGPLRAALVLPRCDRSRSLAFADELRRRFQASSRKPRIAAKLAVGIATVDPPTRHFDVARFTVAAERCLHAARAATGDATKSIEWF